MVNKDVVYCRYIEGPFKGKYNGERRYQVDFSKSTRKMGTYHFLDGVRVRIFYRGNDSTCGRCHQTSKDCPGGGIAKNCEEAGGERVLLKDHMKRVWSEIGFVPANFKLSEILECENDQPIASTKYFPRKENTATDVERFVGITIANISNEVEDEEIKKFLFENVSEEIEDGNIHIIRDKRKAVVTVNRSLTSETVQAALMKINFSDCKTKYFGKPLYCRSLRDITPEKPSQVNNKSITPPTDLVKSSGSEENSSGSEEDASESEESDHDTKAPAPTLFSPFPKPNKKSQKLVPNTARVRSSSRQKKKEKSCKK